MDVQESWAWHLAHAELAETLPRRWAHSQGVAKAAIELAVPLGCDRPLLVAAAVLHDVGYTPRLVRSGFHPLDGARFLRNEHRASDKLARLVANHTFALLEADERGLQANLESEFPILEDQVLVDALTYCDVTTAPDGRPTTAHDRIAEILSRYGSDTVVGRFIQRAAPEIQVTVERVERALKVSQPR